MTEFIQPNWHVILLHYPIALLTAGVLIELVSLVLRKAGFRAAGRWMVLTGTLLALPAVFTGLYALRDEVTPGPISLHHPWYEVAAESRWSEGQWEVLRHHVLYNTIGAGLLLAAVITWMGFSDRLRSLLYLPVLAVVVAGVVLIGIGAWHGGEAVYVHGTGVARAEAAAPGPAQFSPLQLHVLLASVVVAVAVLAIAMALRNWLSVASRRMDVRPAGGSPEVAGAAEPATGRPALATAATSPRWAWLVLSLIALGTAFAGIWSVMGEVTWGAIERNVEMLSAPDGRERLLVHAILGVAIILAPLIPLALQRFFRGRRVLSSVFLAVVVLAAAAQIWFGVLMLFDSHRGPLGGFQAPPGGGAPREEQTEIGGDADVPQEGGEGEPMEQIPPPPAVGPGVPR